MLQAVNSSSAELCHINLARGFRGGERQTELLVRELSGHVPRQRLVVRAGAPLGARLADVDGVTVVPVTGRFAAAKASRGAALIHAHETGAAQAALLSSCYSAVPYIITRRVDNRPRAAAVTRLMYRRAACTVVLSTAIERVLHEVEPRIECRLIPSASSNLAGDAAWASAYRARFPGKVLVGHVGAFDFGHKGQDTLLAAARLLEGRRDDVHFVLVGAGRDEERLRSLAGELANVTVEGWADNVGDYLAAFDLFAFPSVHEGLGSILIDAMQFGLPIVASGVGGITDLVAPGENGLLVPPRDPAALAAALERLSLDVGLRATMAASNRRHAGDYQPAAMARSYLDIYAEFLPRLGAGLVTR
jgi:glycosyltransferase involved in cell wall biosynthesis